MKKTLFSSMLAAALLGGGSAFAATIVEGYDAKSSTLPNYVFGTRSSENACHATLRIYEADVTDGYEELQFVYGGYAQESPSGSKVTAFDNTVIMTGGKVGTIYGGATHGPDGVGARENLVIVSGGTVGIVLGGEALDKLSARANTTVVTGGSIGTVYAGRTSRYADNNSVNIVGTGATYSYKQETFIGGKITLDKVIVSDKAIVSPEGNSLNISGKDIEIGKVGTDFQLLNFHLLEDQLTGASPMVTITQANGLSINTGLKLTFDAPDGIEWKPGDSVTLVEAQNGMSIAQEVLAKGYNIYQNGDPEKIMATAKLALEQGQGTTQFLKLVVTPAIPEPSTGTLSLLALAALAARRRKTPQALIYWVLF